MLTKLHSLPHQKPRQPCVPNPLDLRGDPAKSLMAVSLQYFGLNCLVFEKQPLLNLGNKKVGCQNPVKRNQQQPTYPNKKKNTIN